MVIELVNLDASEMSLLGDTEETKTVFVIEPLTQFEYMKVAGIYYKSLGGLNDEDDEGAMLELFTTEKGEALKNAVQWFFDEKITEVKNVKNKEGKLVTLKAEELNINMFRIMELMELISKTLESIMPKEEELGN